MNGLTVAAPRVFDRLTGLADPIRVRLLLQLERQELTVRELQTALQLPQSTVSRHLKVLAELGWVGTRSEGTSNWYRMIRENEASARKLWLAVREEVTDSPAARGDRARLERILADRHLTSQRFFASSAGQWDRMRNELFGRSAGLLALPGLLEESWTVGDLGCGTGQLTAGVAPFVRKVIGVDESAAMLKAARQRTREQSNVELRNGRLEAPPLEPHELDAALLVLVLHHAGDPASVLAAVRRALVPGGKLLLVDMLPHEHTEYRERMGHQWLGFAESELRAWLSEAGFPEARYVALPIDAGAKGPPLFALTARIPS